MSSDGSARPGTALISFPATMAGVDETQRYASAFCEARRLGPRAERVLRLILEELVTNTVSHGRAAADSLIDVTLRNDRSQVVLRYRDRGIAFDPLSDRQPEDLSKTMRTRPAGGVGWPLIFHYCPQVRYRRLGTANDLELTIFVPVGGSTGAM